MVIRSRFISRIPIPATTLARATLKPASMMPGFKRANQKTADQYDGNETDLGKLKA
jgi:hypothetical protein